MPVGFKATYNGRETEIDDLLIKREFFNDGNFYSWGFGGGQTGALSTYYWNTSPTSYAYGGTNWKQLSYGISYHAAGVKTDGTLWTWGANLTAAGALGDGTAATEKYSPGTTSGGGTNWKMVDCGDNTTAAIKTDGTLWTWGDNTKGRLGDGTTTNRSSPGTTAGGGNNWKDVSIGGFSGSGAGVKTDGTLWTWGQDVRGTLGTGSNAGNSRSSPGTTAGGGTNWKQVSCGYHIMAAVKTDGTLWTWGYNIGGRLGTGNTDDHYSPATTAGGGTNWKQVAVSGRDYGMVGAIKTDGTLWTWGYGNQGQLGDGTTTDRSSPGTTAGGGTNWKQVGVTGGVSGSNACAIKTDGTLWTWGRNNNNQLGDGTTTDRSSPGTTVGGITNWKQVVLKGTGNGMGGLTDLTI